MKGQVQGALWFALLVSILFVGWKVQAEYRYYQTVKKEHQEFFLTPIGATPEGRPFTRKMFFDAMLAESVKAQQDRAKTAAK